MLVEYQIKAANFYGGEITAANATLIIIDP